MANGHWPFYLKIAGQILKDAMIDRLTIRQELGQHYWCNVEFRLLEQEKPPVSSYLGKQLEFIAFEELQTEYSLFDGMVWEAELEYGLHGDCIARLSAVTRSYLLQLTPEEDYFYKKGLREVAEKVLQQDGLELEFTADGDFSRLNYVQWGESDFDFLKRIADDEGCALRPTPKGIEILRGFQDVGLSMRWHDETGLIRFQLKGKLAQPAFDGTCYDPRTMQSQAFRKIQKEPQFFSDTASEMVEAVKEQSQQLPANRLVFDGRAPTSDRYKKLLEKESQRSLGSSITGNGLCRHVRLKPGDKIHLEGLNFDAQGDYGLIAVTHHYDMSQGYRNEFTVTPWQEFSCTEKPIPQAMAGVIPARVHGHNDSRGMGRVQVKYDWMENGARTAWARMTAPSAGGGRGIMFMPEVGDEVLVAFEHGDPERPYIIGALWNGVDSAPRQGFWEEEGTEEAGDEKTFVPKDMARNDIKRIVTKSGHRIQLVDVKGKESIVISTPGGQVIQLIDQCAETGGRQMLALTSPGDIFLNAPTGRVHIRSKFFSKEVG